MFAILVVFDNNLIVCLSPKSRQYEFSHKTKFQNQTINATSSDSLLCDIFFSSEKLK